MITPPPLRIEEESDDVKREDIDEETLDVINKMMEVLPEYVLI